MVTSAEFLRFKANRARTAATAACPSGCSKGMGAEPAKCARAATADNPAKTCDPSCCKR